MNIYEQLRARIRNIFMTGELRKRYEDGKIQVQAVSRDVFEKEEAHFYGLKARAKKGSVFVLCQGGSYDSYEFLPVIRHGGGPGLDEGDAALYAESGGWVTCRDCGEIELYGKDYGGMVKADELREQLGKLTARVDGIMDALKNSATAPNDGGSTYKAGIAAALNGIADKEDFSSIESDKVFHGNGGGD